MKAPPKKDDEDPRIQLINMAFNGPTSCSGMVINIVFLIFALPMGLVGASLFCSALGLPMILSFLSVPVILFFVWRSWQSKT